MPAPGSGFCHVNSSPLRGRRGSRRPELGGGGGGGHSVRPPGGRRVSPFPRRDVYAAGSCGSAVNPALTAGTSSRPARRHLPREDGQTDAGGRAPPPPPGSGRRAALPAAPPPPFPAPDFGAFGVYFCDRKAPGGGSTGAATSAGSAGLQPGRLPPPGTALPHRLPSSLPLPLPPSRQSPPSVGGWAPAAGRRGTLQAE